MSHSLENRYFAMRHGESKANAAEIIISDLEDGIKEKYSLTQEGEEQVKKSIIEAKNGNVLNGLTLIYSSPFSRCKKTAEIAKEILGTKEIFIDERLRERWFGDFNNTSDGNYEKVWKADNQQQSAGINEESVQSVVERTVSLMEDLEKKYAGKKILLVSHGDVLQILETYIKKMPPFDHRKIEGLRKAEIRELK